MPPADVHTCATSPSGIWHFGKGLGHLDRWSSVAHLEIWLDAALYSPLHKRQVVPASVPPPRAQPPPPPPSQLMPHFPFAQTWKAHSHPITPANWQHNKLTNRQTHKRITNKQVVLQPLFIAQSVHVNCGLHFIIDANCRYGSDIGSHQPTASDREPLKQSQNKNPNKVKNKNKEKKSTVKVINKNNKTGNDYNIVYNFWAFVVMAAHICDCLVAAGCYRL